jgi:hypothetical protein
MDIDPKLGIVTAFAPLKSVILREKVKEPTHADSSLAVWEVVLIDEGYGHSAGRSRPEIPVFALLDWQEGIWIGECDQETENPCWRYSWLRSKRLA